jgi:hypothetical protein
MDQERKSRTFQGKIQFPFHKKISTSTCLCASDSLLAIASKLTAPKSVLCTMSTLCICYAHVPFCLGHAIAEEEIREEILWENNVQRASFLAVVVFRVVM